MRSASGTRNCSLADFESGKDNCLENLVVGAYFETYYAEPHAGWEFDHWQNYCTDASDNTCTFKVKADTVQQYWGETASPLVAVFAEQGGFSQGVVSTPHPLAAEAGLKEAIQEEIQEEKEIQDTHQRKEEIQGRNTGHPSINEARKRDTGHPSTLEIQH